MRQEPTFRVPSNALARVRHLGTKTPQEVISAIVLASEGKQIHLRCECELDSSAAVRVDVDGALLLGEVLYTRQETGACVMTVEIDQVIPSLSDLANLLQGILGDTRVEEPFVAGAAHDR